MDSSKYFYEGLEEKIKEIDSQKHLIIERLRNAEALRQRFVETYTIDSIRDMPVENYVIGLKSTDDVNNFNFCFILEYKLIDLGNINGSDARRYGVYYSKSKKAFEYTQKYGGELTAFQTVKELIIDIIEKGSERNIEDLVENRLSPVLKGKILSVYYPNLFLNIFSQEHLQHFLKNISIDYSPQNIDLILVREKIVDYKNSHPIMKDWEMVVFTDFLYKTFTINGEITGEVLKNNDDNSPLIPFEPKPDFIDLQIGEFDIRNFENISGPPSSKNPNYIKQAIIQKRIGSLGEDIVLKLESDRIEKAKLKGKEVRKTLLDSEGYDILSYENDGSERFIEVKAVKNRKEYIDFFITANEYEKAQRLPNYWIYIVFGVLSSEPKVWAIKGSTLLESPNVRLSPVLYKVQLNTVN
ncbi:DUF3883 domain-containing protein [Emticicia soli]|uniref:DUF3883 domain-containing protein n=1 Tax=Emticicia soli TaxID=2027878 RepID=A0ABW5JBR0_9BACT